MITYTQIRSATIALGFGAMAAGCVSGGSVNNYDKPSDTRPETGRVVSPISNPFATAFDMSFSAPALDDAKPADSIAPERPSKRLTDQQVRDTIAALKR